MISAKHNLSYRRNTIRGFTLLELVVVICLISILFVFAVNRLLKLEVEAERVSVQQTLGILQSALAMEIAAHVARDTLPELDRLIGSNPMDLLADVPVNYLGEIEKPRAGKIESGTWYFDKTGRILVYRVRNSEYLRTSLKGPARIRIKIVPVFDDINSNGRYDSGLDRLKGLRLQPVEAYRWTNEAIDIKQYTP